MRLFEITNLYRDLFDKMNDRDDLEDDEIQAYFDTLESIEGEFDLKAESVACFIKELIADINALEKQEKMFKQRREAKENTIKRLKDYLKQEMTAIGSKKIEGINAIISIRNNTESVQIDDEKAFVNWAKGNNCDLLKFKEPEISKTKIKDALKAGSKIPYCSLTRTQSLIIK